MESSLKDDTLSSSANTVLSNDPEDIRNIGFANTIEEGERSLHIQTEVTEDKGVKVKTTVLDGGEVLDAIVKNHERPETDIFNNVYSMAKKQHEISVNKARQGMYDKLDDTRKIRNTLRFT